MRDDVLTLVRRHGWNATAFQTLEDGYSYFFDGPDACVAYVDTGRAWVAAGPPLAAGEALGPVAARFVAAARAAGRRSCFVAAEDRLLEAAGGALRSLRIGDQPVWDPRRWSGVLASQRGLREQLRRARAKGVEVRQLTPVELEAGPTREAVERLAARWLATRTVAPLAFLVQVELFSSLTSRRLFVAERGGQLVGLAAVVPVPGRDGWFLEDLLRDHAAPNGTTELLVDAVMRWAAAEGSDWVTLGLAPLSGEVAPPLRLARWAGALLYGFEGVRAFKAKLRPTTWTPIHLAYPETQSALVSVVDVLAALTRDGFVRFGLRTLGRAPTSAARRLVTRLAPWLTVVPGDAVAAALALGVCHLPP